MLTYSMKQRCLKNSLAELIITVGYWPLIMGIIFAIVRALFCFRHTFF